MNATPLRILIVDDNIDAAVTVGFMLEEMGYDDYSLAHDGPQALDAARRLQPHVILLDIGLPGMNGYEVCRELRTDPTLKHIVVIAHTGWAEDRDREMAFFSGCDYHVAKPLKAEDIKPLLARVARQF